MKSERQSGGKKIAGNVKKNAIAKYRKARSIGLSGIPLDYLDEVSVRVEREREIHLVALEDARKPIRIVGPHVVVGNVFDLEPFGSHFFGFYGVGAGIIANEEDVDVLVPFGFFLEREMEYAHLFELGFGNVDLGFFAELANGRGFDGFTFFNLASGTVPLPLSKAALFHREEDFALRIEDEDERRLAHVRNVWKYGEEPTRFLFLGNRNSKTYRRDEREKDVETQISYGTIYKILTPIACAPPTKRN